jgi:hypothetical protein
LRPLANDLLLVGHVGAQACFNGGPGDATLYDVNRFRRVSLEENSSRPLA